MLLRFRVSNYRSLRDEQELSLVASSRDDPQGILARPEGLDLGVLPVAAIYGANAAGKSNVLGALQFLRDAVAHSHRLWHPERPIPFDPFLLDPASQDQPSFFEVDVLVDGVHYRYGFELDREKVQREWLSAYPHRREQVWFTRDADAAEPFKFGKLLKGNNRTIQALTRKNSLFLSAAAANNHAALLPIFASLSWRLNFASNRDQDLRTLASLRLIEEEESRQAVRDLLRVADLGILDIRLKQVNGAGYPSSLDADLELQHATADRVSTVSFLLGQESMGTRAWLSLAGLIVEILREGTVLCVDELDASLHPLLASEVIRMFQDPARNPKHAQLIFNTHDTTLLGNLLDGPHLRRDQIWFVEKDQEGATHLYPLTDFKPRKDENLERGYLQGRYGAVPFIELSDSLVKSE